MRTRRDGSGHTLVELMAACALLGGCLVGACAALSRAGSAILAARQRTQATILARGWIEEALAPGRSDLVDRGAWDTRDGSTPEARAMADRIRARLPGGHAIARFVPLSATEGVRIEVTIAWHGAGGPRRAVLRAARF